jgi:hypothetical protein
LTSEEEEEGRIFSEFLIKVIIRMSLLALAEINIPDPRSQSLYTLQSDQRLNNGVSDGDGLSSLESRGRDHTLQR